MAAKAKHGNESKKRKKISDSKSAGGSSKPKKLKLSSNAPKKGLDKPIKSSGEGRRPVKEPETGGEEKGVEKKISDSKSAGGSSKPKKLKLSSHAPKKGLDKPIKSSGEGRRPVKEPETGGEEKGVEKKRERRLREKELTEARKKKRKRHYTLEQELVRLWEKMRCRDIAKEARSKSVSEALRKMKGKIPEIAGSHVSSRVLQTCVKYCSKDERDAVFLELRPHFLTLASNKYAVHLVAKMLENASKEQLGAIVSSLRGHVASLLRHPVGSLVAERAYQLGNATHKQALLVELYSTELQLFKDLVSTKESRIADIISKLSLQKSSVVRHMTIVLQPILEKGIVDHCIIHRALVEYFSIADQTSAADAIQLLPGSLLVRMIDCKDGSRIAMLCIKYGSAKERKKIIKGMKGHIGKIASNKFGSMVLISIFANVDDTKLVTEVVIRELQACMKELVLDKNGRRPLLQLLHPNATRYFSPDDVASLNASIPSFGTKGNDAGKDGKNADVEEIDTEPNRTTESCEARVIVEGGKKDPLLRRKELLVNSGLAESLIDTCSEMAVELLKSNFGKEVIYEVATGGAGGILNATFNEKLHELHEAIASLVSKPKADEPEEEHLLENFHSSRTIRKLILDCPSFASILWEKALKGNCKIWAHGHSCKVVGAFLESPDSTVRELAKDELKPLIDSGLLKLPENKQT